MLLKNAFAVIVVVVVCVCACVVVDLFRLCVLFRFFFGVLSYVLCVLGVCLPWFWFVCLCLWSFVRVCLCFVLCCSVVVLRVVC